MFITKMQVIFATFQLIMKVSSDFDVAKNIDILTVRASFSGIRFLCRIILSANPLQDMTISLLG